MSEEFIKEFSMYTDPEIEQLYFGGLPSEGRYFTQKCEKLKEGMFRISVKVPKGDLYYHFFEKDGSDRILLDPNNYQNGAKNWHSICRIGTNNLNLIEFNVNNSYVSMISEETIEIKLITYKKWISKVLLVVLHEPHLLSYEMNCIFDGGHKKYYCLELSKELIIDKEFLFKIIVEDKEFFFGDNQQLQNDLSCPFFLHDNLRYKEPIEISSVYQIFPDSFFASDIIKVEGRKLLSCNQKPEQEGFYGGNIEGIIQKLDYIQNLGIDCIYLTPIFWANSNDRYDCIDYKKIDPMLGSEKDFKRLCEETHKRGMKIILDIVLNHCGIDFWMFDDILKNQKRSKYVDYFLIEDFPVKYQERFPNYSCWWGYGAMPQYNMENDKVIKYLFDCCEFWIKTFDIDGWRIDVSSELDHTLLKKFRKEMRKVKHNVILIGENWKDAREFLRGDELDGVTNYLSWWKAFVPYFCTFSVGLLSFLDGIMSSYICYSRSMANSNLNVLSSHDVPRFFGQIADERNIPIVIALLCFLPGVPVLYYGDENKMQGQDTPDNRRRMQFEYSDEIIIKEYQYWFKNKLKDKALKYGDLSIIYYDTQNEVFILKRKYLSEYSYGVFNLNKADQVIRINEINYCKNVRGKEYEYITGRE